MAWSCPGQAMAPMPTGYSPLQTATGRPSSPNIGLSRAQTTTRSANLLRRLMRQPCVSSLLAYAAMFIVSAVLAVGAYTAHGTVQVVLAILAGIIFAVALWSTVFMSVARIFQKGMQRAFPEA